MKQEQKERIRKAPPKPSHSGPLEENWKQFKNGFSHDLLAIGASEKEDSQKVALF